MMYHNWKIPFITGVILLSMSGCSQYFQDKPEFTTEGNRDTGFQAKTFEETHDTESAELNAIADYVENGVADMKNNANDVKQNIDSSNVKNDIAEGQDNAVEFYNEMQNSGGRPSLEAPEVSKPKPIDLSISPKGEMPGFDDLEIPDTSKNSSSGASGGAGSTSDGSSQ